MVGEVSPGGIDRICWVAVDGITTVRRYACETLPTFVGFKTSNVWYDGLVDVAAVRILVHGKRPGGDQWILTGRGNNHMSNRLIVALTLSH